MHIILEFNYFSFSSSAAARRLNGFAIEFSFIHKCFRIHEPLCESKKGVRKVLCIRGGMEFHTNACDRAFNGRNWKEIGPATAHIALWY